LQRGRHVDLPPFFARATDALSPLRTTSLAEDFVVRRQRRERLAGNTCAISARNDWSNDTRPRRLDEKHATVVEKFAQVHALRLSQREVVVP